MLAGFFGAASTTKSWLLADNIFTVTSATSPTESGTIVTRTGSCPGTQAGGMAASGPVTRWTTVLPSGKLPVPRHDTRLMMLCVAEVT